jgi:hypothetical protein
LILRRKLELRIDDLKELRVKAVPIWCTSRSHLIKINAKLSRIRITTSQGKLFYATKQNTKLKQEVAYLTSRLERTIVSKKLTI